MGGQTMRITFVVPPLDLTGGLRVISIYADQLQRRGHQVVVIAVVLWLLNVFGLFHSLSAIHVGKG